ncbi:response regulator receiver protein [Spiribacter salinus M19-40]|uniref:Response regulator receiver protein n=1 Tax=Spiribacter salinus M19-40 TaxID=1260251 RepID=R4VHN5_9GAMM|nr:LytTR family DNA-binding domain-containing protein [Spiribacter salinus]AGM40132.1 response regulator receiver protein [Spiribacter salinus M19-40]
MKIVIACSNDALRHRLARLVATGPMGRVTAVLDEPEDAIERHQADPAAVILLGMFEEADLQIALALSQTPVPPAILPATSLQAPVLSTLEEAGIDHILDYVQPERLAAALNQAEPLTRGQVAALQGGRHASHRRHILCRRRAGLGLIPVNDVRYFMADHKYVTVQHDDGEDLIEDSLCQLEAEFGPRFLRVHRSALVARDSLRGLEKDLYGQTHALIDGMATRVPVSRRRLPAVRRWLREASTPS